MNSHRIIKPSKWDRSSFLSKLFFCWVWPLIIKGRHRDLEFSDLYQCNKVDAADQVTRRLEKRWTKELKHFKPSFSKAIFSVFTLEFIPVVLCQIIQECVIQVVRPLLLMIIIRYLKGTDGASQEQAIMAAVGLIIGSFFYIIINYISFVNALEIGMRMRIAATALIYKKTLRLSKMSMEKTTVGQMINIISNDVKRFDEMAHCLGSPLITVIQSTLTIYILWDFLGLATLAALSLLIMLIPFQWIMGRLAQVVRRRTALLTDARIRIMSEIITGMRVIKMFNWERPFAALIHSARKKEVEQIKNSSYLKGINLAVYFMSHKVIFFACFLTYIFSYGNISTEVVFLAMSYFNMLRLTATKRCPDAIAALGEAMVSCKRIQDILLLDEVHGGSQEESVAELLNGQSMSRQSSVNVINATARWSSNVSNYIFKDVSFHVNAGELLIIIGPVGAGKTSLLMTLLEELSIESGSVKVNGQISYCPQEPWTFVATIKENILFGSEFDPIRYRKVIKMCALERDFELFPFGDQTIVGERGIMLSGGQKARVNLARTMYNEASIYLLDDPLSAVDVHVAKHIFENCIQRHLREKARILVTHQLQYLPYADRILIMKDTQSFAYGTYEELIKDGIDFTNFIASPKTIQTTTNDDKEKVMSETTLMVPYKRNQSIQSTASSELIVNTSEQSSEDQEVIMIDDDDDPVKANDNNKNDLSVKVKAMEEMKSSGSVDGQVYWQYIKASRSVFMGVIAFVSMIFSQLFLQLSDVWVTEWTDRFKVTNTTADYGDDYDSSKDRYVIIYSLLIVGMFVAAIVRTISFFAICMRSSVNIHSLIFARILRCRISHFDRNPSGRILNRFSKDTSILDEEVPSLAYQLQVTLTTFFGIILVNAYTNVYLLIPGLAIIPFIIWMRQYYIHSCRDIKRLESIARSPIYTHFSNTITGLTSVRCFGVQDDFLKQFNQAQDTHSAAYFMTIVSTRAFGIVIDFICFLYIVCVVVLVIVYPGFSASYAGLALTTALNLTGVTQWGARCSAELESYMTSAERMLEYAHLDLEQSEEERKTKLRHALEDGWPQAGEIVFNRMTLYYDDEPLPVLREISCHIPAGFKVGVVGRTGAGKSSLIAAIFRMCHRIEGHICIDGVDTSQLLLEDLRQSISIIPQDPIIFSGTIRYNIDPFKEHSDDILWSVLEEVQLKKVIEDLPLRLYSHISEGGSNFSVGQKQLICLARAILRDNQIIVMDEATANVDQRTDRLIQRILRTRFAQCTVITVAHRLNTVIDSDLILVLDAGELIEYGHPHKLLQIEAGHFRWLVEQTGERMAKRLVDTAERCYKEAKVQVVQEEDDNEEEEEDKDLNKIDKGQSLDVSETDSEDKEDS